MAPVVGPVLTWKMMLRLEMRRQDSKPAKDSKPNTVMGVEDSQKKVRKLVFDPKRAMDVEDSDGTEEASPDKKRKFSLK